MAVTFVGAEAAQNSAASISVPWPAGIQADDVAILSWNNSDGVSWTTPSGFTLLDSELSGGSQEGRIYYKVLDGNESGSLTLTHSGTNKQTGILAVYRGVDPDDPIDAYAVRVETSDSTSHACPQVVTVAADAPAVVVIQERFTDSSTNYTAPSGYVKRAQPVPFGGGGSTSAAIADDGLSVSRPGGTTVTPPPWTDGEFTDNVLTWTITLTPDAGEAHSGSATMTASLAMAAAGTPDVDGAGQITATLGMTGTGSPDVAGGAGSITGQLAMSARGRADTSIGLPPRPRTRWQLVLGPASGGHELALTEAHGRRYTARLNENSDLSFSIDGRHPQADAIGELTTDVHLLFSDSTGTQILDRCRVGPTRDEVSEDEHRVEVTALDYREVLARRILYSDDTLTYTGVDQAEIAWALVDATQQRPAGHLGIDKGWTGTSPTGIDRDRTYEAGDSIGQRIQELSEVIDGFDWDISPVSASGLQLDVWHPMRGSDRGVVLIYGGLVAHVQREVNPSDYANALRYTGAEGDEEDPGPDPVEIEAPLLGQDGDWPQGRWDAAFGDDGLITQATLNERAAWQLAESQVIRPVYTVRLKRGGWGGPDHIWLGDTVRLIVASGRLRVDAPLRVHEIQLDIDEDGGETATLTLGGPRPDFRRWPSRVDRRLRDLERR